MTILLCVVFVVTAAIHAACAAVIVMRLNNFVLYLKNEPESHPVRKMFNRITRREQVRKFGIQVRA